MRVRPLLCLLVCACAVITTSAQQLSSGRKTRMHDVPTPGVLLPLAPSPGNRLEIDATGVAIDLPGTWAVDPATGAEYRSDEVLVRFREDVDAGARAQALRMEGASRIVRTLPENWEVARLARGTTAIEVARALAVAEGVEEVSLNYRVTTQQVRPNDVDYPLQWNFDAINMPAAWQINPGARSDVTVAVVDTGLNTLNETFIFGSSIVGEIPVRFASTPDLVATGRVRNAYDFVYDDEFPVDLGGHGTHVAGTIAQQTNNGIGVAGVAYNVTLMPLKVISGGSLVSWDDIFFPDNPGGSAAIIAEAIRYAANNGANVINLSLGGVGPLPMVRDAIAYAVSRGAFVAIAAGNEATRGNPPLYPAAYGGAIDGAMTVGAVTRDLHRAPYSSFHPYVEICAPGGVTLSDPDFARGITQVGYEEASTLSFLSMAQKVAALRAGFRPRFDRFELRPLQGTSMAAPHVSGVAALLFSQGIRNPAAIEAAIRRFAQPIEATRDECGAGLVDARRTLRGLGLAR